VGRVSTSIKQENKGYSQQFDSINGKSESSKENVYLSGGLMEKITFNNEQLEFLKFIVQDFEYNDDHERYMIEQIENKIYQAQEHQALKLLTGL